ncbi:MAG: hypothetical protein HY756_05675 [Nitrospirae bacterium]|nr:hypothetical protein [Nitrospirota bacterium]
MKTNRLIIVIILLLITSMWIIFSEQYLSGNNNTKIRAFQNYTGGLGMGASVSPEWGFINYDPRIDHVDETSLWPIPGGYSYSPERGMTVGDIKEKSI